MTSLLRSLRLVTTKSRFNYRIYCTSGRSPPQNDPIRRFRDMMFGKYLVWTNTLSAAGLMFVGDIVCQRLEFHQGLVDKPCDWVRLGQMTVVGGLQGPLTHYFYKFLEVLMPTVSIANVFKKVLLDQLILSPICIVSFFLPASLIEGKSWEESKKELKRKFLTVYTVDWIVWPGAQSINFYFVSIHYRVLYVNVVTMVYNIFLSYIKHDELHDKKPIETAVKIEAIEGEPVESKS